jgi:hypothetical protein
VAEIINLIANGVAGIIKLIAIEATQMPQEENIIDPPGMTAKKIFI